jgi:hypothetical protein
MRSPGWIGRRRCCWRATTPLTWRTPMGCCERTPACRRDLFDRRFAESLSADQPNGTSLIPIEDALDKCVAPVAVACRSLLIVVDGMSIPVFLELHHSLKIMAGFSSNAPRGPARPCWPCCHPQQRHPGPRCFAVRMCRLGVDGAVSVQCLPIARCPICRGKPPAIFHKRDLLDSSGVTLSDDLENGPERHPAKRVVAVVINAVDDHLMKSDQLRLRWDIAQFKGLDALLAEARSSDRP